MKILRSLICFGMLGFGLGCHNYTLTMEDSFGDGWNGGSLNITDNDGVLVSTHTLESGAHDTEQLCLPDGDYHINVAGGSWQHEVSWTLNDNKDWGGCNPFAGEFTVEAGNVVNFSTNATCDVDGDGTPNFNDNTPLGYDYSPYGYDGWYYYYDYDGDGIRNYYDNTPYGYYHYDVDGDGIHNLHDSTPFGYDRWYYYYDDWDGDGTLNSADDTPFGYDRWYYYDLDGDGTPNVADNTPFGYYHYDLDGDGTPNVEDNTPFGYYHYDLDGDGTTTTAPPNNYYAAPKAEQLYSNNYDSTAPLSPTARETREDELAQFSDNNINGELPHADADCPEMLRVVHVVHVYHNSTEAEFSVTCAGGDGTAIAQWIGRRACEAGHRHDVEADGVPCVNVDECANATLNTCSQHATCTDTVGSYNCTCDEGYSGDGVSCAPDAPDGLALEVAQGASVSDWGYDGAGWSQDSRPERTPIYDEPIPAGSSFRLEMVRNGAVVGAVEGLMPLLTADKSFKQIFQTDTFYATEVPNGDWYDIMGPGVAALQPNCNLQGFNNNAGGAAHHFARLGFAMNNEDDCLSNDAGMGIGLGDYIHDAVEIASGSNCNCCESDQPGYVSGSCVEVQAGFRLYVVAQN
jgi:hypothetical protein